VDVASGPLDRLLDTLRRQHPDLVVERLGKTHPSDDANVYFVGLGQNATIVQIDTGPDGEPPFTSSPPRQSPSSTPGSTPPVTPTTNGNKFV
jgi:hypothetical protein